MKKRREVPETGKCEDSSAGWEKFRGSEVPKIKRILKWPPKIATSDKKPLKRILDAYMLERQCALPDTIVSMNNAGSLQANCAR
ncbi:hypothetical protein ACJRO7_010001 [Eucalyptus globulus]|uniref:Uncharacterized protein n=1 Tax=Eucalyptus globulus TaxID=34317 RepID=A0ABD3LAL9_EUCGL